MGGLVRTSVYVAILVAGILALLPGRNLQWSGLVRPSNMGFLQIAAGVVTVAGLTIALWCVLAFALVGRGTPLPFDPPRRLVLSGPYRFVRNPMALGVGLALLGVALFYESMAILMFFALFMLVIHAMVTLYEEPRLRQTFGADYVAYCEKVNRWLPHRSIPSEEPDSG